MTGSRLARLEAIGETRIHTGRPSEPAEFVERIRDANALLLGWDLPTEVMQAAASLELIAFTGIGVGTYVDLDAAARQGITVTNTPGYADRTVAEHALALMMALARKIPEQDAHLKQGRWEPAAGIELAGKHLGIIGFGGIGQRMAVLGKAIGMSVSVWTRNPDRYTGFKDIEFTALEPLLARADVVSVHIALGEDTEGLLDAERLGRMREGALLVNTARGAVVDESALLAALESGHLGGAALDVFTQEPLPADSPLANHSRVVATPHSAYNTPEATIALYEKAIEAIESYHQGAPRYVVTAQ